jgi:hypothetical protein
MITPAASAAASYGMAAASQRFDASAQNIATASAAPSADIATDLVTARVTAPAAYAANAQMSRAADSTRGSLLDILA